MHLWLRFTQHATIQARCFSWKILGADVDGGYYSKPLSNFTLSAFCQCYFSILAYVRNIGMLESFK
jgi:hypothetical protein